LHVASVAVLAVFDITRLSQSNLSWEWSSLKESLHATAEDERLRTCFWFDPSYGEFLEGIRAHTPLEATIAFDAPKAHELYTYEAQYTLSPTHTLACP